MPPRKLSPAAQLGQQLLDALRLHRQQQPEDYLTVRQLAEAAGVTATDDEILAGVASKPFKQDALVAVKDTLDAPVALIEDTERLAGSTMLLKFALERVLSPDFSLCPLKDLPRQAGLVAPLRNPLIDAVTRSIAADTLPPGIGSVVLRKGPALFLERMPPEATVQVAQRLLQALRRAKTAGTPYPIPLRRILSDAGLLPPGDTAALATIAAVETHPQAPFQELQAALTTPPGQEIVLASDRLDAPCALVQDLDLLAGSDALLLFLLETSATQEQWRFTVKELAAALTNRKLARAFLQKVGWRLANESWPEGVAVLTLRQKPYLYLARLRPPPTPAEILAARLLAALQTRRIPDSPEYPTTLEQLLQDISASADAEQLHAVLNEPLFEDALLALPGNLAAPLALREDATQLAGSNSVLLFALRTRSSSENRAASLGDLKKVLARDLRKPFEQSLTARLSNGHLPEGVGALTIRRKPLLFFLEHVQQHRPTAEVDHAAKVVEAVNDLVEEAVLLDFAGEFHTAFNRLEEQNGGGNFVSLVDLRAALPVDRARFDAGLEQLRRDGIYSLSAIEGRHGIKPEEEEAAIKEEGSLLLYVSRKG